MKVKVSFQGWALSRETHTEKSQLERDYEWESDKNSQWVALRRSQVHAEWRKWMLRGHDESRTPPHTHTHTTWVERERGNYHIWVYHSFIQH
jgi:hypothetical protein